MCPAVEETNKKRSVGRSVGRSFCPGHKYVLKRFENRLNVLLKFPLNDLPVPDNVCNLDWTSGPLPLLLIAMSKIT